MPAPATAIGMSMGQRDRQREQPRVRLLARDPRRALVLPPDSVRRPATHLVGRRHVPRTAATTYTPIGRGTSTGEMTVATGSSVTEEDGAAPGRVVSRVVSRLRETALPHKAELQRVSSIAITSRDREAPSARTHISRREADQEAPEAAGREAGDGDSYILARRPLETGHGERPRAYSTRDGMPVDFAASMIQQSRPIKPQDQ